jgi:hypothetical protein
MVVNLSSEERAARVKEGDDLCAIWSQSDDERHRYFVRAVLKVPLLDANDGTGWGLWVEVAESDFQTIVATWSDPQQGKIPLIAAVIANRVPGYPETMGLPLTLRLTGPTTRPQLAFADTSDHPFATECRRGVSCHRVMEWLADMGE